MKVRKVMTDTRILTSTGRVGWTLEGMITPYYRTVNRRVLLLFRSFL
jgi:hypothetical protein